METLHVWPQEVQFADGFVIHSARVEDTEPFTLWFKVREEHAHLLTSRAESFAASTFLLAMQRGTPLQVHAPLSPSFLRNLEELQALWSCWHPPFQRVDTTAESESESTIQAPERAISTFSGGVDSCYTAWRHTQKTCGRRALPLQTSVMVHGSEIGLEYPEMFEVALPRSQRLLSEINVNLVPLVTNFRYVMPYDYVTKWFGTLFGAALLLFQESHTTGLIPASYSYHKLLLPYASTPLNDPLLSTARFPIEHDGAHGTRLDKLKAILAWPHLLENLRVCNDPQLAHVNCGKCKKCITNILLLRILGCQDLPCFPTLPSDSDILALKVDVHPHALMRRVLSAAREAGIQASWVDALAQCIRTSERRERRAALRESVKSYTPQPLWSAGRALKQRFASQ